MKKETLKKLHMTAKQKLLSLIGYASEEDCETILTFFNEASSESQSVSDNEAQQELFNLIKNIQTEIRLEKPNHKNIDFWLYRMERLIKFNND